MKWIYGFFSILTLALIAYSAPAIGDDNDDYSYNPHQYNSGTYYNDTQSGYNEGFQHGMADRQAGLEFNYDHDRDYQMGSASFQSSYAQGYRDAFLGHRNYGSSNYSQDDYGYHGGY